MFLADIKQAEANMRSIASIGADPQTTASWFSWQQQQQQEKPSDFAQLSDEALLLELDRFRKALSHIDGQLQVAKDVFTQPRKEQERDIWEAQLIILQVIFYQICFTSSSLHSLIGQSIQCVTRTQGVSIKRRLTAWSLKRIVVQGCRSWPKSVQRLKPLVSLRWLDCKRG